MLGDHTLENMVPQAIEQEESIFASVFNYPETFLEIADSLKPGDFYRQAHVIMFEAMLNLHRDKKPVDILSVTDKLREDEKLEQVGGAFHISQILEAPISTSLEYTVKIIKQKAVCRRIIKTANEISKVAYQAPEDALEIAQREILNIEYDVDGVKAKSIKDIAIESIERYEFRAKNQGLTGESYGFVDLDEMTCGMQPGDFIIIAGRPAMGKSALAHSIARRTEGPAALFSLEMSEEQLGDRFMAAESGLDSMKLRTGKLSSNDWQALIIAASNLSEAKILINDNPMLTISEISRQMRYLVKKNDVKVCMVDYLQLMEAEEKRKRHLELGEISRRLKLMARDLNVPVVALSQLNRKLEERNDKRPRLADLRESGNLEQDADVVLMVYRDEIYNPDSLDAGFMDVIIRKQRMGPTGTVQLYWNASTASASNASKYD